MKRLNAEEVRKWHRVFKPNNELFEIRLLGKGKNVLSGYFTDIEQAIACVKPYDDLESYQVYFTVNEIHSGCRSRNQYNRMEQVSGSATSKNDIVKRTFLPIDIDVKRPSDISSSDEEKEYAHVKAAEVYRFMLGNGFPEPAVCDSSSGYHLYFPIDMENTDETESLIRQIYKVLSSRFTDWRVKVDSAVGDANRIMRLPGTWGRKGQDTSERPHRMAKILTAPAKMSPCGFDFLSNFVSRFLVKAERPAYTNGGEPFDLRRFISEHGLKVRSETPWENGGTKFVLEECPFDSAHKAPDSALFLSAQGAIGFKCFHDSCAHHDWHELRQMLDPMAYEQPHQYRTYKQRMPRAVKEETPELGKKWLSLSEIEDVSIDSLPRIKTGFGEIDRLMGGGLFLSETTIVSGINGSGKSSWLNTLILNAIQDGHKAALWTGELQAKRLKRWLVQAAAGDRHVVESKISAGKFFVPKNVTERICRWMEGEFFLYNNDYSSNYAQILSDMEEPVKRGVKLFALDNLFAMDLDGLDGDENGRQKAFILALVDFAKRNEAHVILVAHPRKVVSFLRKEDILGSSALQNAVDNIFIIHRCGGDFRKRVVEYYDASFATRFENYGNVIEICKNREFGALEQMIGLNYSTKSRRFTDASGEFPYGWEDAPVQTFVTFEKYESEPFPASDGEAPF